MSSEVTIGQLISWRNANQDTPEDPYDPSKESLIGNKSVLPNPDFTPSTPSTLPGPPDVKASSGYAILGDKYSPFIGPADPASLAGDPIIYTRQLERGARLGAGKVLLHSLTQATLFSQNVIGNLWNPLMLAPPPIVQDFVKPAIDIPDGGTEFIQLKIGKLVDDVLDGNAGGMLSEMDAGSANVFMQPRLAQHNSLTAFYNSKLRLQANGNSLFAGGLPTDPLYSKQLDNGKIPMRLRGDNDLGFRTFEGTDDKISDDEVYMPLSFTDLRPVGSVYRAVYFRPIITSLNESLSPQWNKSQYFGRVDPVATYQSTGRTINITFKLVAFGPEDVRTIYQKLNWLTSMVYPEYDDNLSYKSGPVVRMRVGDVINAHSSQGGKGLPGIIESLDFDYSDAIWELKNNFRLPRNVDVSLSFTVLHDKPIGRGVEGNFGGLGVISEVGGYTAKEPKNITDKSTVPVSSLDFRKYGPYDQTSYEQMSTVNMKNKTGPLK